MGFSLVILILTLLTAPLFSSVFSENLSPLIRLLAILAFSIPMRFPIYLWEKELKFGNPAVAAVISEGCMFLFTILVEILFHLGVWSLLIGNLSGFLLTGLYVWITSKYRPRIQIDKIQVKNLLGFGAPLMVQGLNGEVMARGDNLMVGAYAGTSQLAFYNFAWQMPTMISQFTQTIDSMLLPVFVKIKEDATSTNRLFNLTNKLWSITGSFFGFGMLIFAEQIVLLLYGEAWRQVIPILQVMSISFIIRYCTGYAYDNLVIVRGRTKYTMNWSIVNTILVLTVGQFMIYKIGPIGGAWFWLLQALVLIPLVRFPLITQELGSLQFLRHVWQPLLVGSIACAVAILLLKLSPLYISSMVVYSIITILVFLIIYFGLLLLIDKGLKNDIRTVYHLIAGKSNDK